MGITWTEIAAVRRMATHTANIAKPLADTGTIADGGTLSRRNIMANRGKERTEGNALTMNMKVKRTTDLSARGMGKGEQNAASA